MTDPTSIRVLIKTTINQCYCDFGISSFTKGHLLEMAEQHSTILSHELNEWERKGFLIQTKNIETANEGEICVVMKAMID